MATKTKEKTEPLEGETIAPPRNALTVTPAIDTFMKELLPQKTARDISMSLPEHISFDLFKRNLWNALAHNWKLSKCGPHLLVREVSKAAALGLLLDPLLGEAYLIIKGDNEPQLRIGYRGLIKLARQSGNVAGVWCHEVHQNDKVEADMGYPKRYSHKPDLFSDDRGGIIGYTAVIAYKDDSFDFEPMSLKQCLDIRDRSDAWKAFQANKIKSTPWGTDQSEMCKKTVFNRLMKRQDKSPEMRMALDIENAAEFQHEIEQAPPPRIAPTPPPEETADKRDLASERTKEPSKRAERAEPQPPAEEKPAPDNTKDLLQWIDDKLAEVTPEIMVENPDILGNIWENEIEPKLAGKFPPDVEAAMGIFKQHEKRLVP